MKKTVDAQGNVGQNSGKGKRKQVKTHFSFHYDSGHGWLRVPARMIESLYLKDKITGYSYQSKDGKTVYLEEDMDATTFLDKMKEYGYSQEDLTIKSIDDGERSFIRNLPSYGG